MKILGVIVARGGSKRLPGKNLLPLAGHPLIAWTVRAALAARCLSQVIVSTDCPHIAACAGKYGATVPFLRPAHLATDTVSLEPVLAHALEQCATQGETYTHVFLLQATSPFRTAAHMDQAAALFSTDKADTLTMVCPVREHAYYQLTEQAGLLHSLCGEKNFALPRHELPAAYIENGSGYLIDIADIAQNKIYGHRVMPYRMDMVSSTDIDTIEDFRWAEYLVQAGLAPTMTL